MNTPANNLEQAISAIRHGDLPAGQRLLAAILQHEPGNLQAWLWMSAAVREDERKRFCLEKVLALDPGNAAARQGLAALKPVVTNSAATNFAAAERAPQAPAATAAPTSQPDSPAAPRVERQPAASQASQALPPPVAAQQAPQVIQAVPPTAFTQPEKIPAAPPAPQVVQVAPTSTAPDAFFPFKTSADIESLLVGPSPARQRYWLSPKSIFSRLVLLDPMGLVITNPSREQLPTMRPYLEQGLMPPGLKASKVVPLAVLTEVSINLRDSSASVRYTQNKHLRLASLDFDQQTDRDDFFQALRQRLGPAFKYSEKEYNRLSALLAPVIGLVILAGLTALFYAAAAEARAGGSTDIPGRRTLIKLLGAWLITTLGPTGIAILGGLLMLLVIAWGVHRFRQPPHLLVLTRQREATVPLALAPLLAGSSKNAAGAPTASAPAPAAPGTPAGISLPADNAAPAGLTPSTAVYPADGAFSSGQAAPIAGEPLPVAPAAPRAPRRPFPWRRLGQILLITGVIGLAVCVAGYYMLNYYLHGPGRNQAGLIEGGTIINLEGQGLREVSLAEYSPDKIILIDISENKLRQLPPEIGRFTNLEHLYLANNQLTSLPPEIGQLKKLKTLVLSGNQLNQLPPEIGQLTNLETLDLQSNQLQGFPSELARLKKLQHLWVRMNPLDLDAIPPEVRNLPAWNH